MKKIVFLALVALLLTGGLILASCGNKCPGGGNVGNAADCNYKKLSLDKDELLKAPEDCSYQCIDKQISKDLNVLKNSFTCDC